MAEGAAAAPAQPGQPARPATPEYKWRTFPVYLAFWLGAFIGLELGIIAGVSDNSNLQLILFAGTAMFLGFGMSRLVSVWLMRKNWLKPKPKPKQR